MTDRQPDGRLHGRLGAFPVPAQCARRLPRFTPTQTSPNSARLRRLSLWTFPYIGVWQAVVGSDSAFLQNQQVSPGISELPYFTFCVETETAYLLITESLGPSP
jgi:hypothetical protein